MRGRKHAVWLLAALLSAGTLSMTSMAAEGWSQADGNWVYYDNNGNRVYNEWKKGSDGNWRYLNGDGVMAVNSWIDSESYVDSNGIMVENAWVQQTGDGGETEWYYFGSNGKKTEDNWKKIDNKWYYFDGDGRMATGWILDNMYFTGTDGVMLTGWQKLIPPENYDENSNKTVPGFDMGGLSYGDDGTYWFYFGTNGKKYVPGDSTDGDYGTKKINGVYYCFDEDGIMQIGWKNVKTSDEGTIRDYMYFGTDGQAKIGWYSIEPPQDLDGYDGDVDWFHFANNGKPRAAESARLTTKDLVKLNGKTYLFNEKGNPVDGLRRVYISSEGDNWTTFYFGNKDQRCVQTGKKTVREDDGNTSEFYFSDTGRGYNGVKDNYLYYKGKLQKATDGQKYVCYRVENGNYVVNSSGKVMKNTTVKTSDGVKFKTTASGTLSSADGDTDIDSYVIEPMEPYCVEE